MATRRSCGWAEVSARAAPAEAPYQASGVLFWFFELAETSELFCPLFVLCSRAQAAASRTRSTASFSGVG